MSIFQLNFNNQNKIDVALDRIKTFEPSEGYYLAFSGGKDSIVCKSLCEMSGVKHDTHFSITTVDPPELIKYIRKFHPDTIFEKPKKSIRQLIIDKQMPPTRLARYCCEYLKENGGIGRFVVTGVRWSESNKRKQKHVIQLNRTTSKKKQDKQAEFYSLDNHDQHKMLENCFTKQKKTLNPIIDWSDLEVWEFIRHYNLPYPCLYDEGFKRIGCVGCPMSSNKKQELDRYPAIKQIYLNAFAKMLEVNKKRKLNNPEKNYRSQDWKTAEEVMNWWLSN
jgi:phosphoadenosine phosphosulfate reductase